MHGVKPANLCKQMEHILKTIHSKVHRDSSLHAIFFANEGFAAGFFTNTVTTHRWAQIAEAYILFGAAE